MKLGIMQPYFFPYLGYFDLINVTDFWIVFDSVQYIRHGWINRNRVLHPVEGWSYIVVPVKSSRETTIREVIIAEDRKWKKRILGQLHHYKKKAPYYRTTFSLVEECLDIDTSSISQLNVSILSKVCAYIGIKFDFSFFSSMNLKLGPVEGPGDWALRISEAVGAKEYINPPGGENLFNRSKFAESNVKLIIRNLPHLVYECPGYQFTPNLSVIDILMWNSPERVKAYLDMQSGKNN
jgi:hypothetical protein